MIEILYLFSVVIGVAYGIFKLGEYNRSKGKSNIPGTILTEALVTSTMCEGNKWSGSIVGELIVPDSSCRFV